MLCFMNSDQELVQYSQSLIVFEFVLACGLKLYRVCYITLFFLQSPGQLVIFLNKMEEMLDHRLYNVFLRMLAHNVRCTVGSL